MKLLIFLKISAFYQNIPQKNPSEGKLQTKIVIDHNICYSFLHNNRITMRIKLPKIGWYFINCNANIWKLCIKFDFEFFGSLFIPPLIMPRTPIVIATIFAVLNGYNAGHKFYLWNNFNKL